LLAVAAAGAEENMLRCGSRWGHSPAFTVRWLGFLTGLGYELSNIETEVLQAARAAITGGSDEPEAA
jgi:hypothetical protein